MDKKKQMQTHALNSAKMNSVGTFSELVLL